MSDVRLTESVTGKRLLISTPYDRDFVHDVKEIGGRWESEKRVWSVDVRDADRARELVRAHFGTDGSPEEKADCVTVRVYLARFELPYNEGARAKFAGRQIAYRPGRDEPVQLSSGVVLVEGELPASGGSMKYPEIDAGDAMVEIRDIPRASLDVYSSNLYEIVSEMPQEDEESETERLRARLAELGEQTRELNARLAEIDPEGARQAAEARKAAQDAERDRMEDRIRRRLEREHAADKAKTLRAFLIAQEDRDQDAARVAEEAKALPLTCRCGSHTCAPVGLTVGEYAKASGKTPETVSRWCRTGQIQAVQHGGRWYVTESPRS